MNTNIIIFIILALVGFLAWRHLGGSKQVPSVRVDEVAALRQQYPDLQILDVRTPAEVAQGKIEGALVADVTSSNFHTQIAQLDKSKPYLVYCRSGRRSLTACQLMQKAGFSQVYNLEGGYQAWSSK